MKGLPEFDAHMDEAQVINFEQYLGLLLKWNRAYNLTALNDPIEVYEKHFSDSAMPLQFVRENAKLIDIGTGAGFPGVPIKILRSDIQVTLVDSKSKKVNFCEHVVRELSLKGIKVIQGRAEEAAMQKRLGKFDVVVSRATLKLPSFIKVGEKYVKKSGHLIAMLGVNWSDDLDKAMSQIKKSNLKLIKVHEYTQPISQNHRALLIFEKS